MLRKLVYFGKDYYPQYVDDPLLINWRPQEQKLKFLEEEIPSQN